MTKQTMLTELKKELKLNAVSFKIVEKFETYVVISKNVQIGVCSEFHDMLTLFVNKKETLNTFNACTIVGQVRSMVKK